MGFRMDLLTNPFAPGAGSPPPELVGRDAILEEGRVLFGRILLARSEKSFFLTGLRGVGKTVLLNEMRRLAENAGYHTIFIEAHENKSLAVMLVPRLRNLLFSLNRLSSAGQKARRALAVLKSFIGTIKIKIGEVEFGLDIDPERGSADSGDLEEDLPSVFIAIAEAAAEHKTAIAILIDEVQYFSRVEISALIMTMHQMQQRRLPLAVIGAGLPILPALMGDSKSYVERLFHFPVIGPLSKVDAMRALQDPVKVHHMQFTKDALLEIVRLTRGYPYFLQEWGYQCWNFAKKSPISLKIVQDATQVVLNRLDKNFFRVRFDRLTPAEKNYLRAMAELGNQANRSADIAALLGVKISTVAPTRANLIKKGMIYSPTHGEMAFTVPLFSEFMQRAVPKLE